MSDLSQYAPWPQELEDLVAAVSYKPNWMFTLDRHLDRSQGSVGTTLTINIVTPDSYHPERLTSVNHLFPVPPAAFDYRSWRRWLFEQILLVEKHEAMEFFQVEEHGRFVTEGDKYQTWIVRPFAPSHGFGQDPYLIREIGTVEDQKTSFRNELKP